MSKAYINDKEVWEFNSIGVNDFKFVGQKDEVIYHNADGTCIAGYNASANTSWNIGSASLSGEFSLKKIERYPTLVSGMNFTDEENPTLTITNYGLYDTRVKLEAGGDAHLIERDIPRDATSYTFDLTTAERNTLRQMCTGKTMTVRETVVPTRNGSEIPESATYKDYTMTIVNAEPTFTYSVEETNANVISLLGSSSANTIIGNASVLEFDVSPTAYKYATISEVWVGEFWDSTNRQKKTSSPYTFELPIRNSNELYVSVTDSRGYIAYEDDDQRTLINYQPVKINSYLFKRENPVSSNIILNADLNYWGNIGSYTNTPVVKWKLDNGSWNTIPSSSYSIDTTNYKLTISNYQISNILDYRQKGQFSISVEDVLTSVIDTSDNGLVLKGVATFDVGEHDLQVNGNLYIADINRENAINVREKLESGDIYTTTEEKIGVWIDGKSLYRKSLYLTSFNQVNYNNHNISNVSKIVKGYGICKRRGQDIFNSIPMTYPNWEIYLYDFNLTGYTLRLSNNQFNTGLEWAVITLEYTKTTD
jgi:hypothetical protein